MGLVFGWKTGARAKINPQIAGDRLEKLRAKYGALDARIVVDDATRKRSPLHSAFEWDNDKAADGHRLTQARHMLRTLIVIPKDKDAITYRAYTVVMLENEDDDKATEPVNVYTSLIEAMADPALRQQVLARARAELKAFQQKYQALKELAKVMEAIDDFAA